MKTLKAMIVCWTVLVGPTQVGLALAQVCPGEWTDYYLVILATAAGWTLVSLIYVTRYRHGNDLKTMGRVFGRLYALPIILLLTVRLGQAVPGWEVEEIFEHYRPLPGYLKSWPEATRCVEFLRPADEIENVTIETGCSLTTRLSMVGGDFLQVLLVNTPGWGYVILALCGFASWVSRRKLP